MIKKFTQNRKMWFFLAAILSFSTLSAFLIIDPLEEESTFLQNKLISLYDEDLSGKTIKRYELTVTNSGFCRYKRYYQNGKIEYFSFNFIRYKDLDFLGSSSRGQLYLRTIADDVIVQTYKDRGGDVDSMASYLIIPLKQVEPPDLNMLAEKFRSMTAGLLKQQTHRSPGAGKPQ